MPASREPVQHAQGIIPIHRFFQNRRACHHEGIRSQHPRRLPQSGGNIPGLFPGQPDGPLTSTLAGHASLGDVAGADHEGEIKVPQEKESAWGCRGKNQAWLGGHGSAIVAARRRFSQRPLGQDLHPKEEQIVGVVLDDPATGRYIIPS